MPRRARSTSFLRSSRAEPRRCTSRALLPSLRSCPCICSSRTIAALDLYGLFFPLGPATRRLAQLRFAAAAVLSQVIDQPIHGVVTCCIDQRPPLSLKGYEACVAQAIKVKGKRIRRYANSARDLARCHAGRSCLHEETVYLEPVFLRECSQSRYDIFFIHISTIIEVV